VFQFEVIASGLGTAHRREEPGSVFPPSRQARVHTGSIPRAPSAPGRAVPAPPHAADALVPSASLWPFPGLQRPPPPHAGDPRPGQGSAGATAPRCVESRARPPARGANGHLGRARCGHLSGSMAPQRGLLAVTLHILGRFSSGRGHPSRAVTLHTLAGWVPMGMRSPRGHGRDTRGGLGTLGNPRWRCSMGRGGARTRGGGQTTKEDF